MTIILPQMEIQRLVSMKMSIKDSNLIIGMFYISKMEIKIYKKFMIQLLKLKSQINQH